MSFDLERLYSLLPAIYRLRDAQQGEPLKAVISVIAEQVEVIEEDLSQLYDDQFIETCADWAIPYIGDLVGLRSAGGFSPDSSIPRSEVANAISLRRRKGTASALEELAHSSTGWPARVVEYFRLLATTQHMNHIRPENRSLASLRDWKDLEDLGTPFDDLAHNADIRSIAMRRGRYNIPNVGIFLWRLQSFRIEGGTARKIKEGCYTFHPLGKDIPLFNNPQEEGEIAHIAEHSNVPESLNRRSLYEDLEKLRRNREASLEAEEESVYFKGIPVLNIYVNGKSEPIASCKVFVGNLSAWDRPALKPDEVAVDPALGRLAFPPGIDPNDVAVDYSYGFSFQMGGGGYDRESNSETDVDANAEIWTLQESRTVSGPLNIELKPGQKLSVASQSKERHGRPVIDGSIIITPAEGAELTLNGLLISGNISVLGGAAMSLKICHCTIDPGQEMDMDLDHIIPKASIIWEKSAANSALSLERTICGRLMLGTDIDLRIIGCIIDALNDSLNAIEDGGQAVRASISDSTIIGRVDVREIDATNSIFTGIVRSKRRQSRCIRFCYLPIESEVPKRCSCQPDMAISHAIDEAARVQNVASISQAEHIEIEKKIKLWLKPIFTDLVCTRPGYGQLRGSCPLEICTGAEDGSEMGAFHDLQQPRREANLCERLRGHLRFGLEAGIFYVN